MYMYSVCVVMYSLICIYMYDRYLHEHPMINTLFAIVLSFDPDSCVSMRALYFIAKKGIPVLTVLVTKNQEFQVLIQVRQPDLPSAIIKWLASPLLSHIKPTWKNLFSVLRILNLDHQAKQIENCHKNIF